MYISTFLIIKNCRSNFFRIFVIMVIVPAAGLLIMFSGASAETDDMTNAIKPAVGKEFVITLDANATTGYEWQLADPISEAPHMINPPPSAHWSDEEPGWGTESQDE